LRASLLDKDRENIQMSGIIQIAAARLISDRKIIDFSCLGLILWLLLCSGKLLNLDS